MSYRDPMFICFGTILACDGQTPVDDDSIYRASIASYSKKITNNERNNHLSLF